MEPYKLGFSDELPVETLPSIPLWSENYAFVGYDHDTRTGFSAYVGRWVKNPKLWREQLYLYLPDGTILSHIAIGQSDEKRVPTAGALRFYCDEPGGRWRIAFEGAMRHDTMHTLLHEPILEATPHSVVFDTVIDHALPVLMYPTSENTNTGKYHYEQMGTCAGSIYFGRQRYPFSGITYRDHTRGPRHLGGFDGHLWLQLHFTDGPAFNCYYAWGQVDGKVVQILDKAVSIRPDGFGPAKLHNSPRLSSVDALPDPIELEVSVEDRVYRLQGTPLNAVVVSFTDDFDFFYGYTPSLADSYATEQAVIFECDGGLVRGYIQRSGRMPR